MHVVQQLLCSSCCASVHSLGMHTAALTCICLLAHVSLCALHQVCCHHVAGDLTQTHAVNSWQGTMLDATSQSPSTVTDTATCCQCNC